MTLNAATIKQDCYTLIKSGSAFAAVRAALGAGSTSVIPVAQLVLPAPAAPFLAVGFGPLTGRAHQVRTLYPTLWLYDDVPQGWYRLNALVPLIEAALDDPTALIPGCEVALATNGIDREYTDSTLKRPVLPVRLIVSGRF